MANTSTTRLLVPPVVMVLVPHETCYGITKILEKHATWRTSYYLVDKDLLCWQGRNHLIECLTRRWRLDLPQDHSCILLLGWGLSPLQNDLL